MRRLLVKYGKQGDAALLSHREVMRAMESALRRSGLPLAYSEGHNPHPRVSYSPALPLGVEAEAEYLEVAVEGEVGAPSETAETINRALPAGLRVREVTLLPPTMPKLSRWARYGLYRVEDEAGTSYLLLALGGEDQGRLKDALETLDALRGRAPGKREVTRVGLYASPEEVFDDAPGGVLFYHGRRRTLEELAGADAAGSGAD